VIKIALMATVTAIAVCLDILRGSQVMGHSDK